MKPSFDRFIAERGHSSLDDSRKVWKGLRRLDLVEQPHKLFGDLFPLKVVEAIGADRGDRSTDSEQAGQHILARGFYSGFVRLRDGKFFRCSHIPPKKKIFSLAPALKEAVAVVVGCLVLMSGPILAGLGIIKG